MTEEEKVSPREMAREHMKKCQLMFRALGFIIDTIEKGLVEWEKALGGNEERENELPVIRECRVYLEVLEARRAQCVSDIEECRLLLSVC